MASSHPIRPSLKTLGDSIYPILEFKHLPSPLSRHVLRTRPFTTNRPRLSTTTTATSVTTIITPASASASASAPQAQAPSHLPRILQPSLWRTILPRRLLPSRPSTSPSRPWNPATTFIILGLLIGSQAIQLLVLKKEIAAFSRKAEGKIGLLKEVIRKVREGEEVDVEKMLGTGRDGEEREWEEVMREIEHEELWTRKAQREARRREKAAAAVLEGSNGQDDGKVAVADSGTDQSIPIPKPGRPQFY
ncbi:hypothetical protein K402DRAFT_395876 [Aulographum hederae CBS 113979]|uniref:Uncharacterized protein n=1 Tax=Aulographum hederae CBS 113979 TaxID=1176131 RepID=A0A6G1GTX4_9PEZI|nr:hypothetical protein K402DRAFT_395876 [Aulographum hederae CBS 113979]